MAKPSLYELGCTLCLLLVLGCVLVVANYSFSEGFTGGDAIRCGVDAPCSGHLKCINGFCAKTDPISVKETAPVAILPPGSPAPYF